jgi:AcrR family transcriptional regulator
MGQRVKQPAANSLLPESGGRKPRGRGHERRAEILAAAARMFVERGFENVSTRAIAETLGISQTTLYVYFATKDAILEGLCEQCFIALVAGFRAVAIERTSTLDKLRAMMRSYVEFGLAHEDEYLITFMMRHPHHKDMTSDIPFDMQPAGRQCFSLLADVIVELGREGRLRFDAELVAQTMWAAGHGLVALLITMRQFPWRPSDELITTMIDAHLNGVLCKPPRQSVTNH